MRSNCMLGLFLIVRLLCRRTWIVELYYLLSVRGEVARGAINAGILFIIAGAINITAGGIFIIAGAIYVIAGAKDITAGGIFITAGAIYVIAGAIFITAGGIFISSGVINANGEGRYIVATVFCWVCFR